MGFIKTQVNVNESASQEDMCFGVRQGTLERSITLTVRTQDGQATCKPVMISDILFSDTAVPTAAGDYNGGTRTFTLNPQRLQDCYTVMSVHDNILENNEDFTIVLSTTEMRVIVNPAVATVTIIDDDSEYISHQYTSWCPPHNTAHSLSSQEHHS